MTEDEMVGWHHRLDGRELEQAPGVGDGQGGLACCSPWGRKESDSTERLNRLTDELQYLECLQHPVVEQRGRKKWRRKLGHYI